MRAQKVEFDITDDEYLAVLNETYGEVSICGQTFSAGYVLKELDETAFRCGKNDYVDGLEKDGREKWSCDNCGEEFEEEEDANECCSDEVKEEV